jgi:uncharacterized protein involved in exopolysaccharide biosynthesis
MSFSPKINHDNSNKGNSSNQIEITEIVIVLIKNLKLLVYLPIISIFITIIYVSFFTKPIYTSTAKIMSSSSSGGMSEAVGIASQFGFNISQSQNQPRWVYTEIIKSRTIARSMLERKFDTKKYGEQKTLLQILSYGNEAPQFGKDTLEHIAINNFLGMIEIDEDMKTGILTLNVNSEESKFSASLNSVLIKELDNHQRTYNKDITIDTKQFIIERINNTEKELVTAEEALKVFKDRNRRIENSPALQLQQQRLVREVSVLTGVFTTLKQQLETAKIEEVKESDYVIIIDSPTVPLVRSKPNKKLMVVSASVLGLLLGIISAFINNYIKNSNPEVKKERKKIRLLLFKNLAELIPKKV